MASLIRNMSLQKLQPADTPRSDSVNFFSSSSVSFEDVGFPQVWSYSGIDFVSDGNQRILACALAGKNNVRVEYCGELSSLGELCFCEEIRKVNEFRRCGICSFSDLVNKYNIN